MDYNLPERRKPLKEFDVYLIQGAAGDRKEHFLTTIEGEDEANKKGKETVTSIHKKLGHKYLEYEIKRHRPLRPNFYAGTKLKALIPDTLKGGAAGKDNRRIFSVGDEMTLIADAYINDCPYINCEMGKYACFSIKYDPKAFAITYLAPKRPKPTPVPPPTQAELAWRETLGAEIKMRRKMDFME